jgi:hypothetical protein
MSRRNWSERAMNNALNNLARCGDVKSLESALLTLCSEFGSLSQMDILTMSNAGKRRAVCLLRLDSSTHERNLMSMLGATRFGKELCVVVDLAMPDQAQA